MTFKENRKQLSTQCIFADFFASYFTVLVNFVNKLHIDLLAIFHKVTK